MDLEFSQRTELRQAPRIVPEQIFAGKILQMPLVDLEAFLRAEFQENPALLMEEVEPEPAPDSLADDDDWEPSIAHDVDEEYDPFRTVAELENLTDHLKTQFRTQFPPEDWCVGLDIIESLDEDGYFRDDILDAADRHGLSVPEFEVYLAKAQALEPAGIAARDVRECLSLQAARVDAPPLVLRLLEPDTWTFIARHDAARLAEITGASEDAVREAIEWIPAHTRPYPAEDYRPEWEDLAPRKKPLEKPDVIVRTNGEDLWVDCPGVTGVRLGLDPYYERLYQCIKRVRGVQLGRDEKHIVEAVDRANLIAYAIDLRGQTLHRIADHVVQYQKAFILQGPRYARAYTQKQVAEAMGVHESTVCRATQGKLIQLPSGETVTFDIFFDAALPVRDLVAEIIGHEDPKNPLKDGQVADELERRGVKIARRTVAKYRDQLHILPCEMRRDRTTTVPVSPQ